LTTPSFIEKSYQLCLGRTRAKQTMSKISIEDIFALVVAATITIICVEHGWFDIVCMTLRHGEKYQLDEFAGAGLVFLLAALVMFVRREWQLRTFLGQSAVREQAAHNAARRDYLTGLPNRLALMERLQSSQETKVAFLLVDLDRFKTVNDSYGHAAGDTVLKTVSERLLKVCADTGGFVGRLGGDEFGFIIPLWSDEIIASITDRIIGSLSQPIQLVMGDVEIGASVGRATSTNAKADPDSLLQRADAAMYRNKIRGR